jgi:hypothetical protein
MVQINSEIFIEQNNTKRVLNNITKYCSKCYKEFEDNEKIYLNTQTYEYICSLCACCLSEELETNKECILECQSEEALF